jgi:hypothetical protein
LLSRRQQITHDGAASKRLQIEIVALSSLCARAFAFAAVHLPARAIHAAFDYMLGSLYMKVARARRNKGRIYF